MPFTTSFIATQDISGTPLTITDLSDYSVEGKNTFTGRHLYLYLADGRTMLADGTITDTPTSIDFSFSKYPSDSIDIAIDRDWGFNIVLKLDSLVPQGGSVYESADMEGLTMYAEAFGQSLQEGTQAQQRLMNDSRYKENLFGLYMEIDNVKNSTNYSVLSSAQNAIDRIYKYYINNQSNAF